MPQDLCKATENQSSYQWQAEGDRGRVPKTVRGGSGQRDRVTNPINQGNLRQILPVHLHQVHLINRLLLHRIQQAKRTHLNRHLPIRQNQLILN